MFQHGSPHLQRPKACRLRPVGRRPVGRRHCTRGAPTSHSSRPADKRLAPAGQNWTRLTTAGSRHWAAIATNRCCCAACCQPHVAVHLFQDLRSMLCACSVLFACTRAFQGTLLESVRAACPYPLRSDGTRVIALDNPGWPGGYPYISPNSGATCESWPGPAWPGRHSGLEGLGTDAQPELAWGCPHVSV